MSRKIVFDNLNDLVNDYRAEMSCKDMARKYGVSKNVIYARLSSLGFRFDGRVNISSILPDAIALFNSGIGISGVARQVGVTREVLIRAFRDAGIKTRSRAEQQLVRMQHATPEERQALTDAAHKAVKGVKRSQNELEQRAIKRYQNRSYTPSEYEIAFASELRKRNVNFLEQFPVGKYNCDFIINGVVVEIFGGHWHLSGSHFARLEERTRKLFNAGYHVIFVLATKDHPINSGIADYILSEIETLRRDKSGIGQYRVIWGTPELKTGGSANDKEITVIFPLTNRRDLATGRYESIPR